MPTEWFNRSLRIPTGFTSGEAVVMPALFYADRSPVFGDSPVVVTDVTTYTPV